MGQKWDHKWTTNGPQMDHKWTTNGPQMDQKEVEIYNLKKRGEG